MCCEKKTGIRRKITKLGCALWRLFLRGSLSNSATIVIVSAALFAGVEPGHSQTKVPIANLAKERIQQQQVEPANRQTMPDLVRPKLTFEQAVLELKSRDRAVDKRINIFNEEVPSGVVFDQDPDAGTPLTSDSKIVLYVSKGPASPSTNLRSDVSIEMTLVTKGPFVEGQQVEYSAIVRNLGETPATNVKVVDTPTNLRIDRASGGCSQISSCEIPSIPLGGSVPITISATIIKAGDFDNVVTVKAAESDSEPSNNTDYADNGGAVASTTSGEPGPTGPPPPDPDGFPWWVVVLGTLGGFAVGGIITSSMWWTLRPEKMVETSTGPRPLSSPAPAVPPINTSVSLEPGETSIEDLHITLPPLHIYVSVESGQALFDSPIPIVRKEVFNE